MMKKILLLILLFAGLITKAQFPNTITGGNSSTLNKQAGAYGANLGYVWTASYSDTTAANLSFIKNVPGIVIRIGNDLWMRSANVLVWIKISGSGSGGYFNPDQTSTGNTLHNGNNKDFVVDSSSNITYHLKKDHDSQFDIFASQGFFAGIGEIGSSYYGYYDLWPTFNEIYLGVDDGETMFSQTPHSGGAETHLWSSYIGRSDVGIEDDRIYIDANAGQLQLGNLTNLSTQNRLLGQFGTSTQVGYITTGFGESLASGVLKVDSTSIGVTSWVRTKKVVDSLGALMGSVPTLQQVLTAGSILTSSNTITQGSNLLNFTGTGSYVANFVTTVATSPLAATVLAVQRNTSGSPSNNMSGDIDMYVNGLITTKLRSTLTDITGGSEDSKFILKGLEAGGDITLLDLQPDGTAIVNDNEDTLSTKAYARSVGGGGGGSGTVNTGASGKATYYPGAGTTVDDFAAVDYATSGTNVKITTQNTTDVGLEIKGISSQAGNLLNISSSSGTGDLAIITSAGASRFTSETIGTASARKIELFANGEALFTSDATASIYDPDAFDNTHQIFGDNNTRLLVSSGSGYDHRLVMVTGNISAVYTGFIDGGGIGMETNQALNFITNKLVRATIAASGAITVPEQSAPSTPASATVAIYPKSDGLWYGKDDAGVETMLSNSGSGGLTVGTTTITSGTSTRILYDNAGTLGEYTITGSGTVVAMASAPVFATTVTATSASNTYKLGGSLTVNTTDVGNVGVGEDDLMTYSVPAGILAGNGDYIEFTMSFDLAANGNTKQVKVKFGATTIYASGAQAQNDGVIEITGKIIRTGAATQRITYSVSSNATLFTDYADYVTSAETLSGAITLKATGEAVSNDDIIQKILTVKFFPNN